jgi:hypothetical protein
MEKHENLVGLQSCKIVPKSSVIAKATAEVTPQRETAVQEIKAHQKAEAQNRWIPVGDNHQIRHLRQQNDGSNPR